MTQQPPVLDYGASTYERDFWKGQGRDYEDRAERLALRGLLPPSGGRLIDVGAGFGRLANLYTGYEQVILLDYSPDLLRDARMYLAARPPLTVAASYYDIPLADGACDTVVMVRALHHAADVPRVLGELRRILRPGGALVLEHANKCHLKAVLRYRLGRGPTPFTLEPKEFAYLNYDFHPQYIRQHLARAGFAVEAERAVSTFRVPALKRLVPASLLAGLDGVLQRPLAPLRPSPSVFLRCRAVGDAGRPQPGRPLFRCPRCRATDLRDDAPGHLRCGQCGTDWPIVDGTHRFR
ncbi:MAG TPA: class I SAM-dependent methyltransferase [Anaerolineae bacterium]|nr:class I SAM-dependent methyltransferase [Anaerolineae bacterium]HOQ98082.1 class I SAM-dependent methyltransferase [Anaerolineae bacterium]HPL29721.1 class I SAM-dependent methyltransferase [Anaerolineae bacterium]